MTTFTYNQLPNGLLLADPPESMLGMTFRTMALLWPAGFLSTATA
jgi:hypothetical protein